MNRCENLHFLNYGCKPCDAWQLVRKTPDQVEELYYCGRIGQDAFDAYSYLWDKLSPYRGTPVSPTIPEVLTWVEALESAHAERLCDN